MTETTQLPWGYVHHKGLDKHLVGGVLENVAIVEDRHGNAKENAEFIVKAVNNLDALVAALNDALHILRFKCDYSRYIFDTTDLHDALKDWAHSVECDVLPALEQVKL